MVLINKAPGIKRLRVIKLYLTANRIMVRAGFLSSKQARTMPML